MVTASNKAVFIDRDDTISRDVPYCGRPEDFELLPTVGTGISLLSQAGFKVVVITNQSGVARGYFTEEMLAKIHQKMADELTRYGAHVDAVYYCPHHPDDNCDCRKPKPKLAYQTIQDLNIEPRHSYVMGDRLMDMELARRIGSKSVMIPSETGRYELKQAGICPDYIAPDLETGARWIIQQGSNLNPGSHQG